MYYFVLTIVFFFRGHLENFVRHIFFIQGDGIYWSVPQEMFFYMILPGVFILNYIICRGNMKFMLLATFTLAVVINHYVSLEWLFIYGNGRKLPLWLEVFIYGVFLSYFYHSSYANYLLNRPKRFHDICGVVVLAGIMLSSDGFLDYFLNKGIPYSWNTEIYAYFAALLLFFTISHERSWLCRLMSIFPLRAVGIVGFSFYLLHADVLRTIKTILGHQIGSSSNYLFLLVVGILITYFCSIITYSLIERPFMQKN